MTPPSTTLQIADLMQQSGVKFGTSGARGLACDMRNAICYAYTLAFVQYLLESEQIQTGDAIAIAGDFRPSTPRIMNAVATAIEDAGCTSIHAGFIPTPAVALFAMRRKLASIMVTGSHIPDDRNGIKFYKPSGEILKEDEEALCGRSVNLPNALLEQDDTDWLIRLPAATHVAEHEYVQRYFDFFPHQCLHGLHVGVYEHSTVARDILGVVMEGLGARVTRLARSDHFIPVDTEAIRPEDVALAKQWAAEKQLDCIISADGDGDRPLVSDEHGQWLRGDVAGIFCARYLQAKQVMTPVSSNSAVEKSAWFEQVVRTRIGSPFVIAAMNDALAQGADSVVGYEANGGFLTATNIIQHGKTLHALPTRDALIVPIALLLLARQHQCPVSGLQALLPARFTSSGRIKDFPTEQSQEKLQQLADPEAASRAFADTFGTIQSMDMTDGLRITFANDEVVHLRGSGNAPELRCYNEAASEARALEMNAICLTLLASWRSQ